jgi:iron-sulfur cluster repair protein YtfE (RIC family)
VAEPQQWTPEPRGYDEDYCAGLAENAALLRAGRLSRIDVEHIAEELEDMGKSERRALRSQLHLLLLHLLKWRHQPTHRGVSWKPLVRNARRRIELIVADSPSLRPGLPALLADEHAAARLDAIDETGLPAEVFPATCPFAMDQVFDAGFWPDED